MLGPFEWAQHSFEGVSACLGKPGSFYLYLDTFGDTLERLVMKREEIMSARDPTSRIVLVVN